jgi:hypothetical protein
MCFKKFSFEFLLFLLFVLNWEVDFCLLFVTLQSGNLVFKFYDFDEGGVQ